MHYRLYLYVKCVNLYENKFFIKFSFKFDYLFYVNKKTKKKKRFYQLVKYIKKINKFNQYIIIIL